VSVAVSGRGAGPAAGVAYWFENTTTAGQQQATATVDAVFDHSPAPSSASLIDALTAVGMAADVATTYLETHVRGVGGSGADWSPGRGSRSEPACRCAQMPHWGQRLRDNVVVDVSWDEVEASLDTYPWVVWRVTLHDPDRAAGDDVARRTDAGVKAAAALYGCVYEYCVDDDELADGTKIYSWLFGVRQSEHRLLVGNVPQVVAEVLGELLAALPTELDDGRLWTAGPDLYCTYHRNFIDNGYPKRP